MSLYNSAQNPPVASKAPTTKRPDKTKSPPPIPGPNLSPTTLSLPPSTQDTLASLLFLEISSMLPPSPWNALPPTSVICLSSRSLLQCHYEKDLPWLHHQSFFLYPLRSFIILHNIYLVYYVFVYCLSP